ncbi:hypothetical protein CEXT_102991 [Caerostris extrusa]|uniref:Uncharacterized protein n=1 Tax=Caerostris extrusa TaxID=172846 RepID=A0AAV4QTP7_CAEEX|nr:hypothetical protein CEXT_102991 [Caerostris extrusa]
MDNTGKQNKSETFPLVNTSRVFGAKKFSEIPSWLKLSLFLKVPAKSLEGTCFRTISSVFRNESFLFSSSLFVYLFWRFEISFLNHEIVMGLLISLKATC